jgi:hypothetical protein
MPNTIDLAAIFHDPREPAKEAAEYGEKDYVVSHPATGDMLRKCRTRSSG